MVITTILVGSIELSRVEVIGEDIEEKVEIVLKIRGRFTTRNKIVEVQALIQVPIPVHQTTNKSDERNKSSLKK